MRPVVESASGARRRSFPVHPLLLAIFPVLSLLANNRHEVNLAWAVLPVLLALCVAGTFWGLFALLLRDWVKGAIPASIGVLVFFSFGHITEFLLAHDLLDRYELLGPLLVGQLLVPLAFCAALRLASRPVLITRVANVVAAITLMVPVLALLKHELVTRSRTTLSQVAGIGSADGPRPDIYLIIPDAHARGDVLREIYGYDAEPFFGELESLGFAVARQSNANYSMTPVSVASMLNVDYVPAPASGELSWDDLSPFRSLIRRSAVESLVVAHGYKTVAFSSAVSYTQMDHFDEYHRGVVASRGFYRMVVDLTPLAPLLDHYLLWTDLLSDREHLLTVLQDIPRIARDPEPTFTFVHLCLPHPPFHFAENGEDVFAEYRDLDETGVAFRTPDAQERYREAYRQQAIYTDRRLVQLVREILGNSDTPPVIMVVSDHGPRLNLSWTDAELTDVREALGNLTAVYLPRGRAAELIYPTITPVNVMRIALNEALGTNLPVLEDRAFLSTNVEQTHHLAEVTSRLRPSLAADRLAALKQSLQEDGQAGAELTDSEAEQWLAPPSQAPILRY